MGGGYIMYCGGTGIHTTVHLPTNDVWYRYRVTTGTMTDSGSVKTGFVFGNWQVYI